MMSMVKMNELREVVSIHRPHGYEPCALPLCYLACLYGLVLEGERCGIIDEKRRKKERGRMMRKLGIAAYNCEKKKE